MGPSQVEPGQKPARSPGVSSNAADAQQGGSDPDAQRQQQLSGGTADAQGGGCSPIAHCQLQQQQGPGVENVERVQVQMGVKLVWVHPAHRRKGIAKLMLEVARVFRGWRWYGSKDWVQLLGFNLPVQLKAGFRDRRVLERANHPSLPHVCHDGKCVFQPSLPHVCHERPGCSAVPLEPLLASLHTPFIIPKLCLPSHDLRKCSVVPGCSVVPWPVAQGRGCYVVPKPMVAFAHPPLLDPAAWAYVKHHLADAGTPLRQECTAQALQSGATVCVASSAWFKALLTSLVESLTSLCWENTLSLTLGKERKW
eukprot:1147627-Pelagomonas_calceolata.AAC.2